ncbi:MAG: tetratricopeptide repeat protein [Planctomycetaceae bacterium]|nr:tetratricopeptide repeat protein [Planctomycetaceae bacterium]
MMSDPTMTEEYFCSADSAPLLYQQALTLHRQNRLDDAKTLYRQVLALDPNHAGAWHFLGVIALIHNDLAQARESVEKAIALCDTNAIYHNNYGVVLKTIGCLHEAKTAFEKAITLHSEYADAWSNLGQILLLLKEEEQNIEPALTKALQIVPNHPDALLHLAELRHQQERHAECAELLEKILPRQPNDVGLLRRIAESYLSAKQYDQAGDYLSRAAQLFPNDAEIQHRLGICYGETGATAKAKTHFRRAAALPNGKPPWRWKHLWYCPVYFDNTQQINDYWQQLHCDLDEAIAETKVYDWRTLVYDGFTSSFHLPHHDRCCREIKEKFTQLFAPTFAQFQRPERKSPHRHKIRVGFLVTPGHEGGFYRYTSEIIKRLDPERFEAVLIYHDLSAKAFQNLAGLAHVTHLTFDWNFEASVSRIKNAECDIIYFWKVGADVWNFFLPMCRLAPIQLTSWGTHGTSGVHHIDYSLSCRLAEIENAQEHYTESLYLMDEFPAFQPRMHLSHPYTREELGLPTQGAIYYCPHRLSKYCPGNKI